MHRLLVSGGRDLPEPEIVWLPLWIALHRVGAMIVMHGDCLSGADLYARQWFGLPGQTFNRPPRRYEPKVEYLAVEERHPAQWDRYGKAAGSIRNQEMVNADPDVCYAFPTPRSQGTLDCMARAWVRGVPVYVWHHLDPCQAPRQLTDAEGEKLAKRKLHLSY